MEILIRIFYYNKYLREKENDSFKELNKEENCETVYLINNSWMEEYKSHFNYQYLENYLMNNKEYSDSFVIDNYNLSPEKLKNLIVNLPIEYINEINKKQNFDKSKTFKYEKKESNRRISYTYNNQLINSNIYGLLNKRNYKLNDSIKQNQLYFIGNNKFLLLFPDKTIIDKDIDEIGYINEKGIFIPQYLLVNNNNDNFSLEILNSFLNKEFLNFISNQNLDSCEINDEQNKKIGYCFKLSDEKNNLETTKGNDTKLIIYFL